MKSSTAAPRRVVMVASVTVAGAAMLCCVGLTAQALSAQGVAVPVTPEEHRRTPDQTFLTYPEWFLVHSPNELAAFLEEERPSQFPFLGHVRQFWQGYFAVYEATKDEYEFNLGYHVMVMVIGVSTSVEYVVKAAYETLVGRLTELTRFSGMTEEDVLAARIAQDYVDFINQVPWYEYDYVGALAALWKETSLWGPDPLRKWERKYVLTTEWSVKAVYAVIIKKLTQMAYTPPVPVTAVLVDRLPEDGLTQLRDLKVLRTLPDGTALVTVPRYAAFADYASALAAQGLRFLEIAGNRTVILVSVLVPVEWEPATNPYDLMLIQPILTRPETKRIVVVVPVDELHTALRDLSDPRFRIEHVYDY